MLLKGTESRQAGSMVRCSNGAVQHGSKGKHLLTDWARFKGAPRCLAVSWGECIDHTAIVPWWRWGAPSKALRAMRRRGVSGGVGEMLYLSTMPAIPTNNHTTQSSNVNNRTSFPKGHYTNHVV